MLITHFFSKALTVILSLFFTFYLSGQNNVPDTIYPIKEIFPFKITGNPAVNTTLTYPNALGDINGDGFTDFVFNEYVSDERTEDPHDGVYKSVIITDIDHPENALVFYNSNIQGIKDFDGDGYDDMLNIANKTIYFGAPEGISDDSMLIDFPDDYSYLYYAQDITGDGKSEFFLGKSYSRDLMLFCSDDPEAIHFEPPWALIDHEPGKFLYYDYDSDGVKELAIHRRQNNSNSDDVAWFVLDTNSMEMVFKNRKIVPFSGSLADMNGDGNPDIVISEYFDKAYILRILFGKSTPPYFEDEEVIYPLEHFAKILLAGDINNDGCDDLYTKCHADTMMFFMGRESIADSGFNIQKHYTGDNCMMLPPGKGIYAYGSINKVPVFNYDQDSIPDLFLRYWSFDSSLQYEQVGTAIIRGSDTPDFTDPLLLVQPLKESYEELGYGQKVRNIGDMNKDGYPDFGVMADQGCYLDIFFGSDVLKDKPDVKILLPQDGRNKSLDWDAGDINNDGYIDFIIGNSTAYGTSAYLGKIMNTYNRAFVFLGKEDLPPALDYSDADYVLDDLVNNIEFGRNIRIIGDYNADGYNDFLIGGSRARLHRNKTYLYFGGDMINEEPDMIIDDLYDLPYWTSDNQFIKCGDINADQYDDFMIFDRTVVNGRYLVYLGGPEADDQFDLILPNPDKDHISFASQASRTCRDFNGDNQADFMLYSTDTIYLFYGGTELDSIYDEIFYDTSLHIAVTYIQFLPDFLAKGKTSILAGDYNSERMLIFDGDSSHNQAVMVLNNELKYGTNACMGDFNVNGYKDLVVGIPVERNYGIVNGGMVKIFQSPVHTGNNEHRPAQTNTIIYPNPASNFINISSPGQYYGNLHISLYAMDGRKIMESDENPLYIGDLSKGMYFVRVQKTSMETETLKVIIQ
ncbi:MAG: T9SS type A sorting domain-containing protein [Bacteroidales bacterium]|nr:T9SS type A sorting domain-containing protein [Bacteroidales bacterium]MCF8386654.1 T9SS type A sorting domain-containing protein [Bacteroidales bacterium]MCF8399298.1 T9SS type A sorting domain-containing protein [Bacteroidales bacterium]